LLIVEDELGEEDVQYLSMKSQGHTQLTMVNISLLTIASLARSVNPSGSTFKNFIPSA
jgi:hypothetical protein